MTELRQAGATAPAADRSIVCRRAGSAAERDEHLAIRHRVFVEEQAVFTGSDLDAHDAATATIAVLGYSAGFAVGTVRLFPLEGAGELWQGDRLAVLGRYRTHGVGAPLVRYAVATAAALGGRRMTAHIQPANVVFFKRLGWASVGETEVYAGLPHQPMVIDLPTRAEGLATVSRLEGDSGVGVGVSEPGRSPG
jgi:putative N-acetyltransferase (TIGR04045 family)